MGGGGSIKPIIFESIYTYVKETVDKQLCLQNDTTSKKQETTFQNGHFEQSFECSETKALGNINRSNRCFFTCTDFSKTLKKF